MIEVYVYGRLRQRLGARCGGVDCVIHVAPEADETLASLLAKLGVAGADLAHVFLNGNLVQTQNTMAPWLGYRQARADVWGGSLEVAIAPGDRVGLFGEDMAALVV